MPDKPSRYLLEGEWSGYVSSQRKVVQREVITRKFMEMMGSHRSITYTDGTSLILSIRPCKPGERVSEINQYGSLIRDCVYADIWTVQGLVDARKAREAARQSTAL